MKKRWIALIAPPALVLFAWLFGEIVMHLWNWLLPPLFGWHVVTFWQALGLLALCRILFGGWGGGGGGGPRGRRALAQRWDNLTPEEREKLRESLRTRCGGVFTPSAEGGKTA